MRYTTELVTSLADSIEAAPSTLLTSNNPKTAKGEGFGYLTAIMHLSPHKASGFNVCGSATPGCIEACLNTTGMGMSYSHVHEARIRRTKWFRTDREAFMNQLEKDIKTHVRKAEREELKPAVRLNGTSDIPWENVKHNGISIFQQFPDVQFYDYTKIALRFNRVLPVNYDLTFSLAETERSEREAEFVLDKGGRVAVVFRNVLRPTAQARRWEVPEEWNGRKVVDADKHDLRFLDPLGVYCGLKAKGLACKDTTGFVRDVKPKGM